MAESRKIVIIGSGAAAYPAAIYAARANMDPLVFGGVSMGGLALAWLLADERLGQIVVGPGRPQHLAVVGEALRNPLTPPEAAMVERELG